MHKNFDAWNQQKKMLDARTASYFFREGDVWWCSIGLNVAVESYGKGQSFRRPVLVIKKLSQYAFIGVPLTSVEKRGSWFAEIMLHAGPRYVLLHQIRMYSTNRLHRKIEAVKEQDFIQVWKKLERLLEPLLHHRS